jgi:hypothetical protein
MARGQRPISVNRKDRERLDRYKAIYEGYRGMKMTWGQFLIDVACLGMAAAAIHDPRVATPRRICSMR